MQEVTFMFSLCLSILTCLSNFDTIIILKFISILKGLKMDMRKTFITLNTFDQKIKENATFSSLDLFPSLYFLKLPLGFSRAIWIPHMNSTNLMVILKSKRMEEELENDVQCISVLLNTLINVIVKIRGNFILDH
jgi:hypothetical protein